MQWLACNNFIHKNFRISELKEPKDVECRKIWPHRHNALNTDCCFVRSPLSTAIRKLVIDLVIPGEKENKGLDDDKFVPKFESFKNFYPKTLLINFFCYSNSWSSASSHFDDKRNRSLIFIWNTKQFDVNWVCLS